MTTFTRYIGLAAFAIAGVGIGDVAQAGREGHGGNVVQCQGRPTVVLDYYHASLPSLGGSVPELINLEGLSADQVVEVIGERIRDFGLHILNRDYRNALRRIGPMSEWIQADLKQVDDANEPYILPSGCERKTAAVRQQGPSMHGDPVVVATLSPVQQGLLIVHEALYLIASDHGHKTSEVVRNLMRVLLSKNAELKSIQRMLNRIHEGLSLVVRSKVGFVRIRAGTFQMGSPASEKGRRGRDHETLHAVTLTKDFEMQTTEVTQWLWFLVMGNNPSFFKERKYCPEDYVKTGDTSTKAGDPSVKTEDTSTKAGDPSVKTEDTSTKAGDIYLCPNHPVEQVSWEDVQSFIMKLNEASDRYTYRLPTEAEWEYAARGGTQTAYSFGDGAEQLNDYAWYADNSERQSQAVRTKKPNPYGLHDMHGNVREWVQDRYGVYPSNPQQDPVGPQYGLSRVLRGSAWRSHRPVIPKDVDELRTAFRFEAAPGDRSYYAGFRLVRTAK